MSEQTPQPRRAINRDRIRAGLGSLDFAREGRIFGPAEIIALAGSLLILLLVVVSYLYFLLPAKSRLDSRLSERSLLQARWRTLQEGMVRSQTTEAAVQELTDSIANFEGQQLLGADRGRMSLYDSLNSQIRKHGLRNTSGPTYTALEPAGSKTGATGTKSANTKWQSVYPGIAISVTVEGQYQNLRHFIRDLEQNKQFVIINSVELERSTETNNLPSAEVATGSSRGAVVSLRLDLSTYFQRGSVESNATNVVAH